MKTFFHPWENFTAGALRLVSAAALLLIAAGCPEVRPPPPMPLKLGAELHSLNAKAASPSADTLILTAESGRRLTLRADSAAADIDGVPVIMPGSAVISSAGEWQIPEGTSDRLLRPIMEGRRLKFNTIVIDPGHGGRDAGALSHLRHQEKDLNLLLAKALAAKLRSAGFKVFLTREDDRFLTLDERPALAKKLGGELFISIHHNASGVNFSASGPEVYILESDNDDEAALPAQSACLAFAMQKELAASGILPLRGVKRAGFKVLRLAHCPAVLVEAGFLTTPAEADRLVTGENRQTIAEALCTAIRNCSEK